MKRKIIHIDQKKCNGCGLCAEACHEGAIDIIDGKAHLVREHFCDGLGDCLPHCPTGAIHIEEREAPSYDEEAVKRAQAKKAAKKDKKSECHSHEGGCPGSRWMSLKKESDETAATAGNKNKKSSCAKERANSQLKQWPCQIKLIPTEAPFFKGAKLLVAADCTAFAYANLHEDFMKGRITLIGCPKLDGVDYSEKLTAILANNDIRSLSIVRMEVPCCGGLEMAAKKALKKSGKMIPWQVVTISRDGRILESL